MGLNFLHRRRSGGDEGSELEKRFGAYFPGAFAYAYSNLGDEAAVREVVGEAFTHALLEFPELPDSEFRIELFRSLRALCRERRRSVPLDIGLGAAERDVVTLTFDAGLTADEVDRVLGGDKAAEQLTSALKRMRGISSPSIVPTFFRLR